VNPYAAPIKLALGTLFGIVSWYAAKKTKQANQADTALRVVVNGVENAGEGATPANVKTTIADLAGKQNVYPYLDKVVQEETGTGK
jgi:hypothetical protein